MWGRLACGSSLPRGSAGLAACTTKPVTPGRGPDPLPERRGGTGCPASEVTDDASGERERRGLDEGAGGQQERLAVRRAHELDAGRKRSDAAPPAGCGQRERG